MMEAPREAYPLTWPTHQPRTPDHRRRDGQFRARGFGLIRDELLHELALLGARGVILSSNIPVRLDGLPYANTNEPRDGGVAVYFNRKSKPFVIACDSYNRVWKNLRAISCTVEALRAIERYGSSQMLEQAFTGFAALPPARAAEPSWWDVLGVSPEATADEIQTAHRKLIEQHHPDVGGEHERAARINRARDTALEERS